MNLFDDKKEQQVRNKTGYGQRLKISDNNDKQIESSLKRMTSEQFNKAGVQKNLRFASTTKTLFNTIASPANGNIQSQKGLQSPVDGSGQKSGGLLLELPEPSTQYGSGIINPPQSARNLDLGSRRNIQSLLGAMAPGQHFSNQRKSQVFFSSDISSPRLYQGPFVNYEFDSTLRLTKNPPPAMPSIDQQWTHSFASQTLQKRLRYAERRQGNGIVQSDYITRKKKYQENKLQRDYDEAKNQVKSRRELLESLKNELEQIKILRGNFFTAEPEEKAKSPPQSQSPEKSSNRDIMKTISLSILRPSMINLGSTLQSLSKSLSINNHITHLGNPLLQSSQPLSPNNIEGKFQGLSPSAVTVGPQLSKSLYQPYYKMQLDDLTIQLNLQTMKDELLNKLKDLEYKGKQEFYTYNQLVAQHVKEKREITIMTLRNRDLSMDQRYYQRAVANLPRMKMLGDTSRELSLNLLGERRKQLEDRRQFYNDMLKKRVRALKIESKELDELKAAIAKRQIRVDEMKSNLQELRQCNREEEVRKQDLIRQLISKNLEFKVLSGIEIIVKLEEALKSIDDNEVTSIEKIKELRNGAVQIEQLNKEDFDRMNKKKVVKLQLYESHFKEIFPDIKQISINDEFLQKSYNDICISISSQTSKYQELVQKSNLKKQIIKQFMKVKNSLEEDMHYFKSRGHSIKEKQVNSHNEKPTLNQMKTAEYNLNTGLINSETQQKQQYIANIISSITRLLQKSCFILKEILQLVRFEDATSGKDIPDLIHFRDYINNDFLLIISDYATLFAPDCNERESSLRSRNSGRGERNDSSQKKQYLDVSSHNSSKGFKYQKSLSPPKKTSSRVSPLQKKTTTQFMKFKSPTKLNKKDENHLQINECQEYVEKKDYLSVVQDFNKFFKMFYCQKYFDKIFLEFSQNSFSVGNAIHYLKNHKILSQLYDIVSNANQMDTQLLINGLQYTARASNRNRKDVTSFVNKTDSQIEKDSNESMIVPEEDYVDARTKKIITKLLLGEKDKNDLEERKRKKEAERQKTLAKMNERQRIGQCRIQVQKQVFEMRAFEKDELDFRNQFKQNIGIVFSKQLPKSRETNQYLLLDGSGVVQNTAQLMQQKNAPKRQTQSSTDFKLATSMGLQRLEHQKIHSRFNLKSQNMTSRVREVNPLQYFNNHAHLESTQSKKKETNEQYTQRLIQKQMQRRSVVKVDKPAPKQQNVVLQMLQNKFPELEQLFMDTAERRELKRKMLLERKGSLQHDTSRLLSPPQNNYSSGGKHPMSTQGSFYGKTTTAQMFDDTTSGGHGGLFSEDQTTSHHQQDGILDIMGTHDTFENDSVAGSPSHIIKVKPVYHRGQIY